MNTMPTELYGIYRKRGRTAFTQDQLSVMQEEFNASQYLSAERRRHLARELNLEEEKIKVWFQNRRQKSRGQRGVKGTKRILQEDADSTVTSPDCQTSKSILQDGRQEFDQGPSPRQNPYENYGFSDAEVNYHLNLSQRRNLKPESDTSGLKGLPFSHSMSGRQQRVPFVSVHQYQQVSSNVSKIRKGLRFNTHPYKRMNPSSNQHSGPHLSTMQSYSAAANVVNPFQNNEASAAYNRNGCGRSQLVQDNWQAQMIPQQFNGYRMTPDAQLSQSPSIYKREFIPRAHSSQQVNFASVQQSQQHLHQPFNRQIMINQGQWSRSPSFNRRQPMPQYHSSQYVQQNNNVYYQDRKHVFPIDLSNGNVLERQSFNCKVEGSSLPQRRNIIQNSSLPSCSYSNNVPISRKLPSSGPSTLTHYDNSCQFETLPLRPSNLSSSAFASNFQTSSSFQNGMREEPVEFQNNISSDESSHLANYSPMPSSSFNLASSFPMSSSTRHGSNGFCEPPMKSQNMQEYPNFPSVSTINTNTSGSSLADLCYQIPLIKDEIIDNSSTASIIDPYSSMSSVENICDELMAVQDSKASESFNDTYFLGGPNEVQSNRVNSRHCLPGSNMPFFKNPNDSFEIAHLLGEENDLFDRNNAYANSNVHIPTLSKSGFNNPAYSQVGLSYNHVDGLTIQNGLNNFPFYPEPYASSPHQLVQPVVNASGMDSLTNNLHKDSQISSTCNADTFLESQSNGDDMAQLIRDVIDTERYTA